MLQRGGSDKISNRIAINLTYVVHDSVISYEEQVRGRLAEIARTHSIGKEQVPYDRLAETLDLYCKAPVLAFDEPAIAHFQRLWLMRLRVGTMDLKIAAIALAHDAKLLTRNMSDFEKVPGLLVENWSI